MPTRLRSSLGPLVLAAAVTAAGLAGCGAGDVSQDTFTSELAKKSQLTEEQARCVTDDIYAGLDQGQINDLYAADTEEEISPEALTVLNGALESCGTASAPTTEGG